MQHFTSFFDILMVTITGSIGLINQLENLEKSDSFTSKPQSCFKKKKITNIAILYDIQIALNRVSIYPSLSRTKEVSGECHYFWFFFIEAQENRLS